MNFSHRYYDPKFFKHLVALEDRHFWFRSRNRVISTIVKQLVSELKPGYRMLEVGCGNGNVLRMLTLECSNGSLFGMDLFTEGLQDARSRTECPLVQGDIRHVPFREEFDLVGLFDVLEHLPDDQQVLLDLYKLLKPGGCLLLTVPAHPTLWSYFDEASCHQRRYRPDELQQKLIDCGYAVEYFTQYMMLLLPFLWGGRRMGALHQRYLGHRKTQHSFAMGKELSIVPGVNEFLRLLLAWEALWIARRRKLPIGTSLLAIARKS